MTGYCVTCGLREGVHCACPKEADAVEAISLVCVLVVLAVMATAIYFKTHPLPEPHGYQRPPCIESVPWRHARAVKV